VLISIIRFAFGLILLGFASASDFRTRRVNDWVWIAMGGFGLAILEAELLWSDASWEHQLIIVPTAIIFFAVFFGEEMWTEKGFRFRPVRLALYLLALSLFLFTSLRFWNAAGADAESYWAHVSMPVLLVIAHLFYQFGVLRGGADAKAFMSIALLVPSYPTLVAYGLPIVTIPIRIENFMNLAFPFALVVLLDAALILVFLPLTLLILNAAKGDFEGLISLFGYKVDIDKLPRFAWLMDRIDEGQHTRVLLPRRRENREEQVRLLKEKGLVRVWVTPQIPFLVPMTVGFVAAFVIGNFALGLARLFGA